MGDPASAETTARYLARRLIEDRGYTLGTVPEARALADASDLVLTCSDGVTFQVICLVDREREPSRRFPLSAEEVIAAGKACAGYVGRINLSRMPVAIQIWEVGAGVEPRRDLSRRLPLRNNVVISSWALDTASRQVHCTVPLNGFFAGRRSLERLLREPRGPGAPAVPPVVVAPPPPSGPPVATLALLTALVLAFAGELVFGLRPWSGLLAPDIGTVLASGGLMRRLVAAGEWWRLVTVAFLHADAVHLALNGVALYLGGRLLEPLVGRAWLLALFAAGTLGGAAASCLLNPPTIVSLGASGAIMGLFAAGIALSYRFPAGPARWQLSSPLLRVLIPSLIPLASRRSGGHVDYAAHLGGALAGALAGLVLLRTWRPARPSPPGRALAWVVAGTGAVVLLVGLTSAIRDRGKWAAEVAAEARSAEIEALLIPQAETSGTTYAAMVDRAVELVAKYPRDPRAHQLNASRLLERGDPTGARAELWRALQEPDILSTHFPPELEVTLRAQLAELLVVQGERAQAEGVAAPACRSRQASLERRRLTALGLCGK
jgi:rhomboid protease GluP